MESDDHSAHDLLRCRRIGCEYFPPPKSGRRFYKTSALSNEEYEFIFTQDCAKCDLLEYEGEICIRCRHLRLRHILLCVPEFMKGGFEIDYSFPKELLQRPNCDLCQIFSQTLHLKVMEDGIEPDFQPSYDNCFSVRLMFGGFAFRNSFQVQWVKPWVSRGRARTIYFGEKGVTSGCRSISTPNWTNSGATRLVQWEKIRQWISECDKNHNHMEQKTVLPRGFKVVDIKAACVVEAPENCRYIALSYVWGQQNPGQEQSHESVLIPDGWSGVNSMPLTKTIKDAMAVCTKLGVQYLWVDRLCIVQDENDPHKMAQIQAMDSIYSLAYLTICALHGDDAEAGLVGLENTPRSFNQELCNFAGIILAPELPRPLQGPEKWWSRGWTCQEYLLAGRKLLFNQFQVSFQCSRGLLTEGPTDDVSPYDFPAFDDECAFANYKAVINEYNTRNLSKDSDIYNAFMGIFKKIYGGLDQFHCGLPLIDFDEALLSYTYLDPSLDYISTKRDLNGHIGLPSWSWVRSKGETRYYRAFIGALIHTRYWHAGAEMQSISAPGSSHGWILNNDADPNIRRRYSPQVFLAAAWSLGLFERTIPEELKQPQTFKSLQKLLSKRWPSYSDFWAEMYGSRYQDHQSIQLEGDPHLLKYLKSVPSSLAVRAMVGSGCFKAFNDRYGAQWSRFHVCDPNTFIIGQIELDEEFKPSSAYTPLELIALSVGLLKPREAEEILNKVRKMIHGMQRRICTLQWLTNR